MDRKQIRSAVLSVTAGVALAVTVMWGTSIAWEVNEHYKREAEQKQREYIKRIVREVLEQGNTTGFLGYRETKKW